MTTKYFPIIEFVVTISLWTVAALLQGIALLGQPGEGGWKIQRTFFFSMRHRRQGVLSLTAVRTRFDR
jgi:hypothetical protein